MHQQQQVMYICSQLGRTVLTCKVMTSVVFACAQSVSTADLTRDVHEMDAWPVRLVGAGRISGNAFSSAVGHQPLRTGINGGRMRQAWEYRMGGNDMILAVWSLKHQDTKYEC
jgi:hypothetical protein